MGRVVDPETGFQYLHARYYDPATGQFMSRDPIVALTRSAYGYVAGNPLNLVDPSGLDGEGPGGSVEPGANVEPEESCGDESPKIHSRYPDGTPVNEGQQPGKIQGPDPEADGDPHTRLQWDDPNGRIYKGREYGPGGVPVRDIDWTYPTYPNGTVRPGHGVPEQHHWIPNDPENPKAGYKRGPGGPLL